MPTTAKPKGKKVADISSQAKSKAPRTGPAKTNPASKRTTTVAKPKRKKAPNVAGQGTRNRPRRPAAPITPAAPVAPTATVTEVVRAATTGPDYGPVSDDRDRGPDNY
jgi:hypothetical protein